MPNNGYFDIERDNTFPCFCEACLVGKMEVQMSERDIRYCLECQSLIEGEYKIRGEKYIPVLNTPEDALQAKSSPSKTQPMETHTRKSKQRFCYTRKLHPATHTKTPPRIGRKLMLGVILEKRFQSN